MSINDPMTDVPDEDVTGTEITAVRYDLTPEGVERVEVAKIAGTFTFRAVDEEDNA